MDLKLNDHVAVITGGAAGIGRACAAAFLAEGARVVLWDRADSVSEVAAELTAARPQRAAGLVVDITSEPAVRQAAQATLEQFGRIDHLVHAAAIGSGKYGFPFTNLHPADWRRVLEVIVASGGQFEIVGIAGADGRCDIRT